MGSTGITPSHFRACGGKGKGSTALKYTNPKVGSIWSFKYTYRAPLQKQQTVGPPSAQLGIDFSNVVSHSPLRRLHCSQFGYNCLHQLAGENQTELVFVFAFGKLAQKNHANKPHYDASEGRDILHLAASRNLSFLCSLSNCSFTDSL